MCNWKSEWIETYLELGNKMPLPFKSRKFSGNYSLRMDPSLHETLALLAENEGVSLNQYMVNKLAIAAGQVIGQQSSGNSVKATVSVSTTKVRSHAKPRSAREASKKAISAK